MSTRLKFDGAIFNPTDNGGQVVMLSVEEYADGYDENFPDLDYDIRHVINITAHSYGSSESKISIHTFDANGLDRVIDVLTRARDKMSPHHE